MMTPEGGQTLRRSMIRKLGSESAYREHMTRLGAKGGRLSKGGGFGQGEAGRERARKFGAIGGRISRRPKRTDGGL